jgi:hypothetical protein
MSFPNLHAQTPNTAQTPNYQAFMPKNKPPAIHEFFSQVPHPDKTADCSLADTFSTVETCDKAIAWSKREIAVQANLKARDIHSSNLQLDSPAH